MVKTTKNKVIIEFQHVCPTEAVKDLQRAIITSVQNQTLNELSDLEQVKESNYMLLEVLRNTLKE